MAEGLLDFFKSPEGQGLLAAGFGALAGRGTRAQAIGQGGLAGLLAYGRAGEMQADRERQNVIDQRQSQMFDWQKSAYEQQQAAARAEAERQAKRNAYLSTIGQYKDDFSTQQNKFDPIKFMQLGGSPAEAEKLAGMGDWGRTAVDRTIESQDAQGNKVTLQFDKFGRQVGDGVQGYIAPERVDLGGSVRFVRPQFGLSLSKSMTPGEAAADRRASQRLQFEQSGGVDGGGISQAGLVKQFGKPPAGFRWKPDGSMEFIPGGPADQKAQLQKSGEGTVSSVIAELRDKYNVLDAENAIVSENNKWGTNIAARLGSTGFGQTLGGAVGTKAQSARDSIAMTRPLLLQAIMKATGMSAKQMDSNAELKMYLATATDPTLGLEANRNAMDQIERLYGGGAQQPASNPPSPPKPQGKTVVKTGTFNGRKVVQYSDGTTAYVD